LHQKRNLLGHPVVNISHRHKWAIRLLPRDYHCDSREIVRSELIIFKEHYIEARIDYLKVGRSAFEAMLGIEKYLHRCGIEPGLLNLIRLRASQINGCAYCIDMHWKDLRAAGETEQRLYGLDAWEESPYYSDRERAALAWTEAVTNIQEGHVPDSVYEQVRKFFTEKELDGSDSRCHGDQ
jgi:AhpD family alkylhydroperoxidase